MQYFYTARFLRSLKKYEEAVQDDVFRAVKLFEKGKSDEILKLHKLHGKFKSYHAFSANFSYRVIVKIGKGVLYYADVGTHDMYL
jgi:mRNA-degrading endonuclease YafQ of YafQ-DinJ toxin-antitoxin module